MILASDRHVCRLGHQEAVRSAEEIVSHARMAQKHQTYPHDSYSVGQAHLLQAVIDEVRHGNEAREHQGLGNRAKKSYSAMTGLLQETRGLTCWSR